MTMAMRTGMVRRIDDLGRVAIPKEIRRNANIQEGDPLELGFANGCIILEKYTGEFDEETGKPIIPKQETIAPTPKKIKLYVDTCEQKAYKTLEEIISIMDGNGELTSFEEWLSNNYSASSIIEELEKTYEGNYSLFLTELNKEYLDHAKGEAQDLIDNPRNNDYIEIEVEI